MNPRKKDRVQTVSEFLKLMNCTMPTIASEVLSDQEETQVLPQKLSGNLLDTHEQTIVAPKKEENVEYIDEEDNTSNSRKNHSCDTGCSRNWLCLCFREMSRK